MTELLAGTWEGLDRVEPDYDRADAAFNEALKLAGAEAHGPTRVITRFIVNAAIGDAVLVVPLGEDAE